MIPVPVSRWEMAEMMNHESTIDREIEGVVAWIVREPPGLLDEEILALESAKMRQGRCRRDRGYATGMGAPAVVWVTLAALLVLGEVVVGGRLRLHRFTTGAMAASSLRSPLAVRLRA
jgi:hypothetical protein